MLNDEVGNKILAFFCFLLSRWNLVDVRQLEARG
jgi:hypothetical protein